MVDLSPMDDLKKSILKDGPRLREGDTFRFACRPNMPCFTKCCGDVNIILTPYDVIRLKRRLGMSSEEFLEKHCLAARSQSQRLPVVLLRMTESEDKKCPFVGEEGCTVYEDRPWACRMYPVGIASPKETADKDKDNEQEDKFYFLLQEDVCEGFREKTQLTIRDWIEQQGADQYDELGELFKEISLHPSFLRGESVDPGKLEMLHMVCYNLDKFRRFVFESTFLERFEVDGQIREEIRDDDVALLKFGFRWLKFCLFNEGGFEIKETARKAAQAE